ncbi:MAG: rRNA pseudouridine synthase [Bacteroidia bacterium]|nr:rRNA pseudouridine synthase [Bacteroidia bacterium]
MRKRVNKPSGRQRSGTSGSSAGYQPGKGSFERASRKEDSESRRFPKRSFRDQNLPGKKSKPEFTHKPLQSGTAQPGLTRLNKYISNSGICSRREADELISAGLISVNGKIITELGTKIAAGDIVKYNGEKLFNERKRYILLNKPKDFITTADDPEKRNTVMLLIRNACKERVYPVGRLDRNTTGLLLFTNDGELAKKLMHPSYQINKLYHVETDKPVTQLDLKKLIEGITMEDGLAKADEAAYAHPTFKNQIGISLHEGRNRIVRRMFEALGYEVKKLDRVMYAGLTKRDLPRGKWRHLTETEVNLLRMMTGQRKPKE